jgi:hypothetical protein
MAGGAPRAPGARSVRDDHGAEHSGIEEEVVQLFGDEFAKPDF